MWVLMSFFSSGYKDAHGRLPLLQRGKKALLPSALANPLTASSETEQVCQSYTSGHTLCLAVLAKHDIHIYTQKVANLTFSF